MRAQAPGWLKKAKEIAARAPSPFASPFVAKREAQTVTLYLYDQIGTDPWTGEGVTASAVVEALKGAKADDSLEVHINSPGGEVFEGVAIANAIKSFPGKRTVYVDGLAASIASVIALAGDRVVTSDGAMWMIHDPSGGIFAWGGADQIEEEARKTVSALRKVRESLVETYVNQTGRSISEVSGWMTAETWMTASEALERGFTDEVTKPMPMDPDEEEMPMEPRKKALASPHTIAALARAKAASLREQFPGASPGTKRPGQPGNKTAAPAKAGKDE